MHPHDPGRIGIAVHHQAQTAVAAVSGEVDMATAPTLRRTLRELLDAAPAILIVDLSTVGFLGSAGLDVLAATAHTAPENTDLRVVAAGPATLRPLTITGLDRHLHLYSNLRQALTEETPHPPHEGDSTAAC